MFDGTTWSQLATTTTAGVYGLFVKNDFLYVVGGYSSLWGYSGNNVFKYDLVNKIINTSWGIGSSATSVYVDDDDIVYIVGNTLTTILSTAVKFFGIISPGTYHGHLHRRQALLPVRLPRLEHAAVVQPVRLLVLRPGPLHQH